MDIHKRRIEENKQHALPRKWMNRSTAREMTTITLQTTATTHVGVYSKVVPPSAIVLCLYLENQTQNEKMQSSVSNPFLEEPHKRKKGEKGSKRTEI